RASAPRRRNYVTRNRPRRAIRGQAPGHGLKRRRVRMASGFALIRRRDLSVAIDRTGRVLGPGPWTRREASFGGRATLGHGKRGRRRRRRERQARGPAPRVPARTNRRTPP